MSRDPMNNILAEYALIAALVSTAAVAAADASYFAVAGLCFVSSIACCRRLGRLIGSRLDRRAGATG